MISSKTPAWIERADLHHELYKAKMALERFKGLLRTRGIEFESEGLASADKALADLEENMTRI